MDKKLISIVSSCYNEQDNLPLYYDRISKIMDSLPDYDFECLLADNGSTDNTEDVLKEIAKKDNRFKIVINLKNYGPDRSGGNLLYRAKGDAIISLASDLQDPPEMISTFIKEWENGHKIVWAQREKTEESFFMESIRRAYYSLIKNISESEEIERANGFGIYDKEVIDWIKKCDDPIPFVRNQVTSLGYKPYLVPFKREQRKHGKSSYNLIRYCNDAFMGVVSTSKVPLRLGTYLGFATAFMCLIIALAYFIYKLVYWDSFTLGQAPLVIGLFFVGAVQLICIGFIGEYLGEVLNRVKKRPLVIEKETINFEDDK